jgi:KUP system potassium uptake protein
MATTTSGSHGAEVTAATNGTQAPAGFLVLAIGSIGVVYGDIGTSPLYAFREAILAATGGAAGVQLEAVLGVLSLIFWTLIVVVTLKYILILMHADNRGEGGTLALMALAQRSWPAAAPVIVVLGVVAASLFYGDAMIAPALSVLSAVEGLEIAAPSVDAFVLPLTFVILLCLFLVQWRGTAKVAAAFGPVMSVWFVLIGIAGFIAILGNPHVLVALNPLHAIAFATGHGVVSLLTLGAVFLCVTGAEALYEDLGHFGRKPIQTAWIGFVLPALVLNYFGQGALVLTRPETLENPFFLMSPAWAQLPMK